MSQADAEGVREQSRRETRRRLLKAASELFAERPASQVKATDITRRAKVSTGSLYVHMGSKDGALEAVLASAAEGLRARIEANWAAEPASALEILEGSSRAIVEMFQEDRALVTVYLREGPNHPRFAEALLDAQRAALRRGQSLGLFRADLPVESTSYALIGLIRGLMAWWVASEQEDTAALQAELTARRADILRPQRVQGGAA